MPHDHDLDLLLENGGGRAGGQMDRHSGIYQFLRNPKGPRLMELLSDGITNTDAHRFSSVSAREKELISLLVPWFECEHVCKQPLCVC